MLLSDLQTMIRKDVVIRKDELDSESIRTPLLHDDYLKLYLEELRELRNLEQAMKPLIKSKNEYYLGKADPEVYRIKPFDLKVKPIKSDLSLYLDADEEMMAARSEIADQEMKVDYLRDTLKSINQRGFQIRDTIEWIKFKNGLN